MEPPSDFESDSDDVLESVRTHRMRKLRIFVCVGVSVVMLSCFVSKLVVVQFHSDSQTGQSVDLNEYGAVDFPNIGVVTQGYNIYYADPSPPNSHSDEHGVVHDPGLRKNVFAISYSRKKLTTDRRHRQLDGYHTTVDSGCATSFTSKSIVDTWQFTKETSKEVSLTVGVDATAGVAFPPAKKGKGDPNSKKPQVFAGATASIGVSATGTLSHTSKQVNEQTSKKQERFEQSVARCSSYISAIEFGDFPEPDPDFHKRVEAAGQDPSKHYALFNEFGTHFFTTVKMGGRSTVMTYVKHSEYKTMVKELKGVGVSVGVAAGATAAVRVGISAGPKPAGAAKSGNSIGKGAKKSLKVSAKATLLSPKEKTAMEIQNKFVQKQTNSYLGPPLTSEGVGAWSEAVKAHPTAMKTDRRSICMHPSYEQFGLQEVCDKSFASYCKGHLQKKMDDLQKKKDDLQRRRRRTRFRRWNGSRRRSRRRNICKVLSERECTVDPQCKDGFECLEFKCVKMPMCQIRICDDHYPACNGHLDLEPFSFKQKAAGKIYSLTNGGWDYRISAVKLSKECREVELVDKGNCKLGRDTVYKAGTHNLGWGPNDYTCMIRAFAQPAKDFYKGRKLQANGSEHNTMFTELAHSAFTNTSGTHMKIEESDLQAGSPGSDDVMDNDLIDLARINLKRAEERFENMTLHQKNRRLHASSLAGDYIKNIGKGLYGYNHFFGAPASSENAGTDPGFIHRPLWADTYTQGNVATMVDGVGVTLANAESSTKTGEEQESSRRLSVPEPQWLRMKGFSEDAVRRLEESEPVMRELISGPPRTLTGAMKVPDGFKVKMGKAVYCETDFSSDEVKSSYDYNAQAKDSFSLGGIDLGYVSFDYSAESQEFRESNGQFRKMMVSSKAECASFVLEITDLKNNPPPPSESFKFIASSVGSVEEFYILFDMFGLHFPSKVLFGSRYGYTRYTDEKGYKSVQDASGSSSVAVGVSYTQGVKKGGVKFGVTVSAKVKTTVKNKERTVKAVEESFTQVKECSVGKRMPDEGGIQAWVKDVGDEPMPIRFDLVSLCNHPVLDSKQSMCEKASKSYCSYLKRNNRDVQCHPIPRPSCLFDLDCKKHEVCVEGSCMPEPNCNVSLYSKGHFGGWKMAKGPVYYSNLPDGMEFDIGMMAGQISSYEISGGCAEVILMDKSHCRLVHKDNIVETMRTQNTRKRVGSMGSWINDDVCRVKLVPKKRWYDGTEYL